MNRRTDDRSDADACASTSTSRVSAARAPCALALAIALSACPRGPEPARPSAVGSQATAFVDVSVVPLDEERVLARQTVVVSGDKIVAIGPTSDVPVPHGARVIDGRGKYLMPGLADMHAHVTHETYLPLYLALGVTTVRNMWGTPMHLSLRDRIQKGEVIGPTIYTAGPIVDGARPVHDGSLVVRTEEEADRAVAMHTQAGYDFIKVYSRISSPVFERLVSTARQAGLSVVGHVARDVGVARAVEIGQAGIEHVDAFTEALQAEGSPVAGKFDEASQDRKIDFVDRAKLAPLVRKLRDRGAWVCPTLNLFNQLAPADEARRRLTRPEMRFIPASEQAIWSPEADPPAAAMDGRRREVALGNELVRAMREGGVRLLLGTDTGNPFVVPGFTLHEELALLVHAGLTPYQALRAGTHDAAEMNHASAEVGTVAVGLRADLLLVDGNPLADVTQAGRIAGVMARGRFFGAKEREALLESVVGWARGDRDPLAGLPELGGDGQRELAATYAVTWKNVPFDTERVLVERTSGGARVVHAQTIDPHKGQTMTAHVWLGARGVGERLVLESDGARGRGRVEVTRRGARAHVVGTLLSGAQAQLEVDLPEAALLGADHFLAGKLLLAPALMTLAVGASLDVREAELALGSFVKMPLRESKITRQADATLESNGGRVSARRYEIATDGGAPNVLLLDQEGAIVGYEIPSYEVKFRRVAR